jgi:hypothetical protein
MKGPPRRFITAVTKLVAKSPNMPPRWSPKIHNLKYYKITFSIKISMLHIRLA